MFPLQDVCGQQPRLVLYWPTEGMNLKVIQQCPCSHLALTNNQHKTPVVEALLIVLSGNSLEIFVSDLLPNIL